jgi:hypothetical protein
MLNAHRSHVLARRLYRACSFNPGDQFDFSHRRNKKEEAILASRIHRPIQPIGVSRNSYGLPDTGNPALATTSGMWGPSTDSVESRSVTSSKRTSPEAVFCFICLSTLMRNRGSVSIRISSRRHAICCVSKYIALMIQEEGVARVAVLKPLHIIGHKAIYDSGPIRPLHDDLATV